MYIIVETRSGQNLVNNNTGKTAEFVSYDEAKAVLDTLNLYTNVHFIIVSNT